MRRGITLSILEELNADQILIIDFIKLSWHCTQVDNQVNRTVQDSRGVQEHEDACRAQDLGHVQWGCYGMMEASSNYQANHVMTSREIDSPQRQLQW